MDNELIELARLMYNDPYSEIAPDILPQLCDALEAAQAENAQLRAENMNYAVNICPEQDRIIAKLTAAVTAFLEFCDVPQCDPEGPYNPDYGKHIFDLFKRAEDLAREATK